MVIKYKFTGRYQDNKDISSYLKAVENDILDNTQFIRRQWRTATTATKYFLCHGYVKNPTNIINIVIDNSETTGAPSSGNKPTYHNLLGRTEKEAQFGALTTTSQ